MNDTGDVRRPRPARRRRPIVAACAVLLLIILLVVADRAAAAYAEHRMAQEIRKEGFPAAPDVTIKGVPFLTQVASRDFPDVRLKARDIAEGPLNITRLDVRARDVHLDSGFRSGTLGTVDGTAFVSFGDLAKAGGDPDLELSADGPDKVRAKVDLAITEVTATARVTKEGDAIRVQALAVEGLPLDDLGDALDFTVPVRGLPLGLAFQSLTVSEHGIGLRVTGRNVAFTDR
ncbi:LmeA family phospholipid-binding protein [Actinomadura xylanilytica]|uniref:LmeA family phospholipid-binding protein n=1 Tax=Actinomadura xylanilytica TaxID=887459 RepID=UPI00255B08CC|nr:DUF2993 domain-containing protein [Actinomadura xylanilytica]MDL4775480.1 DUF2993 domain-containing protein [Actinomadura xylanilytica]